MGMTKHFPSDERSDELLRNWLESNQSVKKNGPKVKMIPRISRWPRATDFLRTASLLSPIRWNRKLGRAYTRRPSFIARTLHPLNSRIERAIEEACDNRRQTVHFYEALDRADLRSRSIAAHTIFQESLTGEFAWETERSSYQIRHCRCKKKREGLRANTTKREREKGKSRRKGNRDLRWMCLEDHRIVPICLDTSLHEETREDSDRVHGNPFYEKRKSYRWQIRNKKRKENLDQRSIEALL